MMGMHILSFVLLLLCSAKSVYPDQEHDAREGDDVTMQCRFSLEPVEEESLTYYWLRAAASGHENVAIGNKPLETNYRITPPTEGRYDLTISNVSYERDNGRFDCRVKAVGSGRTLHSQRHMLTVLTRPRPPVISPRSHVQAQEGNELTLTCSSSGGSPEPDIKWYRDDSSYPLEAVVTHGKTRTEPSTSTLVLSPTREDDGAQYSCAVWNRAMPPGENHNTSLQLSVNYFPRIEIGPENPLRIEIDQTAIMECKVDAKPAVKSVRWSRDGKLISNAFTLTIEDVSMEDAGTYTCSADNGLGRSGEQEIYLDVLYPPSVSVESKTYEAEEGGTVEIRCEVNANPEPISIEWTMEEKPDFRQKSNTLHLTRVNADMSGTYVCRAVNVITSNGKKTEKSSSATVAVLVRHKPGRAFITPDRPIAQEGTAVTLTCGAKPPGWPLPQYRWFRDINTSDSKPTVLATGNTYSIPSAHLGSEGAYQCQATNELGHGDLASVTLEVHQPPRFQIKLLPHMIRKNGERDFSLSCSAIGKPRPNVRWYKDGQEIKPDTNTYEVKTDSTEAGNAVFTVLSTLKFNGKARPNTNDIHPDDRGIYACTFENEVKKVESTMHLRIEHEPIMIKLQEKVAYDISEPAEIACRVQAYPKPEFQWYYESNGVSQQISSDTHYDITTTTDSNDSYYSLLKINKVRSQDYGDYSCRVKNTLGSKRPLIRLQPKGAPESPRSLEASKVGPSYVTLKWEPGFDGGLSNTKYFVSYRRMQRSSGAGDHCSMELSESQDWMEYDCGRLNPCNVTRLDQHSSYRFKVKAVNTKGQSNFSNDIPVTTKVDKLPAPEQVTYDPNSRTITFGVAPTCLTLVGVVEGLAGPGGWQVMDTVENLKVSGAESTLQESVLELPAKTSRSGRLAAVATEFPVRIKLCLKINQEFCSDYTEAEIGVSYNRKISSLSWPTTIALVVSFLVFVIFLSLLFVFCRCRRKENELARNKSYETESMKPSIGSPQNQAPPPYYPSTGMENKALEHSMDLALSMEDKNGVYATQAGYGYHVSPQHQPHANQNINNTDWNMAYMENSYTNSPIGGSVNSQDSLWQMKMAAGNNQQAPQLLDRQSNYGYDPLTHGGYGTIDDYAPYPQLGHTSQPDYMRSSHNPSRQEYCSDPYASVHKPKKRIEHNMESPYHEVSGLPETYPGDGGAEEKPPHLSLSYDESLESGYSTPNSRARRVIREIIV